MIWLPMIMAVVQRSSRKPWVLGPLCRCTLIPETHPNIVSGKTNPLMASTTSWMLTLWRGLITYLRYFEPRCAPVSKALCHIPPAVEPSLWCGSTHCPARGPLSYQCQGELRGAWFLRVWAVCVTWHPNECQVPSLLYSCISQCHSFQLLMVKADQCVWC